MTRLNASVIPHATRRLGQDWPPGTQETSRQSTPLPDSKAHQKVNTEVVEREEMPALLQIK